MYYELVEMAEMVNDGTHTKKGKTIYLFAQPRLGEFMEVDGHVRLIKMIIHRDNKVPMIAV